MALLSTEQAIGLQVFWILISVGLLGGWLTQFNRLTVNQSRYESRQIGSNLCVALVVLAVCLDSSDPFGDANLFDGKFLRSFAMLGVMGNAFWCLINATDLTSVLLVLVNLKLKPKEIEEEDEETDEGKWDKYTMVEYGVGSVWLIIAALLGVDSRNDNSPFPIVFVVVIIIGMIASVVMTSAGLYRAYAVKLGSRDEKINDKKKNARRLLAIQLYQVIAVHLIIVGLCITDLLLGCPWDAKIEGDTQTILLIYGFGSRTIVIYALAFNWIPFDEKEFVNNTLAARRKDYKVMCVEQKIDSRIQIEKENSEKGGRRVLMDEDLAQLNTREFDEYDLKMNNRRERGETEMFIRETHNRLAKGKREKQKIDEKIAITTTQ